MSISDIRIANLRKLAAIQPNNGGWTELAQRLGYSKPSFLVQMAGPAHGRKITEKSVRKFEAKLGLPYLSLDKDEAQLTLEPIAASYKQIVNDALERVDKAILSSIEAPKSLKYAELVLRALESEIELIKQVQQ